MSYWKVTIYEKFFAKEIKNSYVFEKGENAQKYVELYTELYGKEWRLNPINGDYMCETVIDGDVTFLKIEIEHKLFKEDLDKIKELEMLLELKRKNKFLGGSNFTL